MNAFVRFASLLTALGLAVIAFLAPAAPAHAIQGRYFTQEYNGSGYVDIDDINMSNGVLSCTVIIEATRGEVAVNPLYWSAKADDGTKYDWPDYSVTTLGSGDLPAGERARGTVGFEIDGPRPTRIVFEDVLGDRLASWTIRWHKTKQTPTPASPFGSFGS